MNSLISNLNKFPGVFALLLFLVLGLPGSIARADDATVPVNGSFEQGDLQPTDWETHGDVTIDRTDAFAGKASLLLHVDALKLIPTDAVSAPFPVSGGAIEISGATKSDLYFQDLSFNGTIFLKFLDASGKDMGGPEVLNIDGKTPWKAFTKTVPVPAGATKAQLGIRFEKTYGKLWVDGLTVKASTGVVGPKAKTKFVSKRLGNMFFPGDDVGFQVNLLPDAAVDAKGLEVTCTVTDYWGLPQGPSKHLTLDSKTNSGWLDLSDLPLKVGKYYELRTEQDLGGPEKYKANTSFAIVPTPAANDYAPEEIPFGGHTWDDRVKEYFFLNARVGVRRVIVFWDWPMTPPYTPDYTGWEKLVRIGYPQQAGQKAIAMCYPIINIEHDEKPRTEQDIREGTRQTIEKFGPEGIVAFQMGNEPPSWDIAKVKRNVEAYRWAYEEAKKTNPNIFMIGSAIGPDEDYFKLGFGKYCDAYNMHSYGSLGDVRNGLKKYKELFAKYGDPKPIYSTELGSKSQGLSRHEIAMDLIRKSVCFLHDGGRYLSWFAVTYPDPDGKNRGTYGDSMNLFDGYLETFAARIDAVAYYHIINTMLDKKAVSEQLTPDGTDTFLFRNDKGECLQALWNTTRTVDSFIPLPGVGAVTLTHTDGTIQQMDAGGKGITLHITDEPMMLTYTDAKGTLPMALDNPIISVPNLPENIVQGGKAQIQVHVAAGSAGKVTLVGPPDWKVTQGAGDQKSSDGGSIVSFIVDVPPDTTAQEATFIALLAEPGKDPSGELSFRLPIASSIQVALRPLPADSSKGEGHIEFTLGNQGSTTQTIDWNVDIENEYPLTAGAFDFGQPSTVKAHFTDVTEGKTTLKAGEEKKIVLNMAGVDRLAIYRLKAQAQDATGKSVTAQRLVAGFVGVPKATGPITIDGNLSEADWAKSPVLLINEQRQAFKAETKGHWRGPDDLSGKLRFLWDDKNLYVGVEVTDDVFLNRGKDDSLWGGDGLQFLINPDRDQRERKARYDISLGLGQKGPQAWLHMSGSQSVPEGELKNLGLGIKRLGQGGNTNYEIAIPWSDLVPFQPSVGRDLGLSMIINEDDGEGRAGFVDWFSGVHLKEMDHVGDLILQP